MQDWLMQWERQPVSRLSDVSYNIFTYHGEDGIIQYILQQLKNVPPVFVDAGAGNCIIGNCSTLAVHFGWDGVFMDRDKSQITAGKKFLKNISSVTPGVQFLVQELTPANINQVIAEAGIEEEIGLLSVDVDGNDYWLWKAIDVIQPRIVVIEAKVEFGLRNVIVPYGLHNHRSVNLMYNGASVEALRRLGDEKGYKLVGAIRQGYNLFFVKKNEPLQEVSAAEVLWNPETISSFYSESFFEKHKFAEA